MTAFIKAFSALFKFLFAAAPGSQPNALKIADVVRSVVVAFSSGGLAQAIAVIVSLTGLGSSQAVMVATSIVTVLTFVADLCRRYFHSSVPVVPAPNAVLYQGIEHDLAEEMKKRGLRPDGSKEKSS